MKVQAQLCRGPCAERAGMIRPDTSQSAPPAWHSPAKAGVLELESSLSTLRQRLAAVIPSDGHPPATDTRPRQGEGTANPSSNTLPESPGARTKSTDARCKAVGIPRDPEQSPEIEETCPIGTLLETAGQAHGVRKLRHDIEFVKLQLLSTQRALARLLERNRKAITQAEHAARSLSIAQDEFNVSFRRYDEFGGGATSDTPSEASARKDILAALASIEAFGDFCDRAVDGSDADFDRAVATLKTAIALKQGHAGLK